MNAHIRAVNFGTVVGLPLTFVPAVSSAAELTNETLQAWEDYIRSANLGMEG